MFSKEINKELELLSKSNNYRGMIGLAKDYIEITVAIAISIYFDNFLIYILSIVFIGSRQRALATILHDSAHRVLCKNSNLNDILGKYFSGYLIFQSFTAYVKSHVMNHHNFLGVKGKDPDYEMYIRSGVYDAINKKEFIFRHLVAPFFLSKSPLFVYYLFKERFGNLNERESINIILYWFVILLVSYYFSMLDIVVMYWFIPLFTTFPMIGWFIELSEHYPIIESEHELYKTWNRFGNKLEGFLTGMHNENYHLTHHLRADIPYWNIDKAHKIMMNDPEYNKVNQSFGGIISSSNRNNKSIIKHILSKYNGVAVLQ
ncbi:fatty acid desaturase family protein [Vibrio navarrensis]|uniref:Phosphoesterase n=1 Tax=Vibrio navarrensis TaxID=29495 RepID=A0A099LNV0_9VIBR|nr:fatty acid desaturase family protein [Vibrio navarrensis]EKO3572980.1 fatty acid desaturase family protein [Vibrio metschnikovii]KGK09329.1 phosphoesterase [Vibrio navarrensis]MBE4616975.1 phosphoesterase [Vibrio navarrensis]QOD70441.1 fatty acid desaturase family protein [Vibrio navarrensis]